MLDTLSRKVALVSSTLSMCMWPTAQEAVAYHCFRGLLVPDTAVLLDTAQPAAHSAAKHPQPASEQQPFPEVSRLTLDDADAAGTAAVSEREDNGSSLGSEQSRISGLLLLNRQPRASREPSANIVNVYTNDGEVTTCNLI